jgi:hypothetical protein
LVTSQAPVSLPRFAGLPVEEETLNMAKTPPDQPGAPPEAPAKDAVRFNTSNLKSSYANVCNATSSKEEVVLNFGLNQSWERATQELEVELTDRIVLSPFAAKRLSQLLAKLVGEYERRYGELK